MMMLEPVQGYVRDMSLGGIFVNTSMRLAVGEEVELEIQPRDRHSEPLSLRSEVVRVVNPIGAALRFVDASEEMLKRLEAMLRAEGKQATVDLQK